MPVTTSADALLDAVITACRDPSVATAGAVDAATWAASSQPRVDHVRTAGRRPSLLLLPRLDVGVSSQAWRNEHHAAMTRRTTITLRVTCRAADQVDAAHLTWRILTAALASLRQSSSLAALESSASWSELMVGPGCWWREARIDVDHHADPATYEVSAP